MAKKRSGGAESDELRLKVRYVAPASLLPAARNPRVMPEHDMEALKRSLQRFGFVEPIIVRREDGRIVGGHQRVQAAIEIGLSRVPVVEIDIEEIDALILNEALNRVHGDWDEGSLALHQEDIRLGGGDLSLTGFTEDELKLYADRLRPSEGLTDEDEVPKPPEEPTSKLGDLWLCGDHRLLCGDATKAEDVERLMVGEKADCVFTDPPYGIAFDGSNRPDKHSRQYDEILTNDDRGEVNTFASVACDAIASILRGGGVAYIFTAIVVYPEWRKPFERCFRLRAIPIWVKDNPAAGRSDFFWGYEPILYGTKGTERHTWNGGRGQSDVWQFRNVNSFGYVKDDGERNAKNDAQQHPTQKPVDLVEHAIKLSSNIGQIIADPFLGSGTTMIACEKLGRRCYAMEIEPKYVDVAIERFSRFVGRDGKILLATDAGGGIPYEKVCEMRRHEAPV